MRATRISCWVSERVVFVKGIDQTKNARVSQQILQHERRDNAEAKRLRRQGSDGYAAEVASPRCHLNGAVLKPGVVITKAGFSYQL